MRGKQERGGRGEELKPALGGPFVECGDCLLKARRKRPQGQLSRPGCRNFHNSRTIFVETLQVPSSSPAKEGFLRETLCPSCLTDFPPKPSTLTRDARKGSRSRG